MANAKQNEERRIVTIRPPKGKAIDNIYVPYSNLEALCFYFHEPKKAEEGE